MNNLWEEKNSTEPKKNCSDNIEQDNDDITKKINKDSIRKDLNCIINKNIWTRNCPVCNKEIIYKWKSAFTNAIKNNRKCRKCWAINRSIEYCGKNNPFYGKNHSVEQKIKWSIKKKGIPLSEETKKKISESEMGEKNPFYVKHHTYKTKKLISIKNKGRGMGNENPLVKWLNKSDENRKSYCEKFKGEKNGMFGKKLSNTTKKKLSIKNSGKGNPMYGKPSPMGSGTGWKCWYKNWFFRSLRELQYYITEIENKNLKCENAQKLFSIKYKDYFGVDRTYKPDFLVENKYLIEIKPKKMWNTPLVLLKKKAAEKFCKTKGLKYKILDIKLDFDILKQKYANGEITFLGKYKEKFENYGK